MIRRALFPFIVAGVGVVSCLPADAQPPAPAAITLTVAGHVARALTASELAKAPRQTVSTIDHEGKPHTFEGVPLHYLLSAAGVTMTCRGDAIAQVATVASADGYRAAFGIGELIPELAPDVVLLADHRDGQPLSATTGPWQLVVPGDRKPTRWVRQVRDIRVGSLPAEAVK